MDSSVWVKACEHNLICRLVRSLVSPQAEGEGKVSAATNEPPPYAEPPKETAETLAAKQAQVVDNKSAIAQYSFSVNQGRKLFLVVVADAESQTIVLSSSQPKTGEAFTFYVPDRDGGFEQHQGTVVEGYSPKEVAPGVVKQLAELESQLQVLSKPEYIGNIFEHLFRLPGESITARGFDAQKILMADRELALNKAAAALWGSLASILTEQTRLAAITQQLGNLGVLQGVGVEVMVGSGQITWCEDCSLSSFEGVTEFFQALNGLLEVQGTAKKDYSKSI